MINTVLEQISGIDKGQLRHLIYALVDIDALTYSKVSTETIKKNLDRAPHLATLLNVPVSAGSLTLSGSPTPDISRIRLLFDEYRPSYESAMATIRRQQQARTGNFKLVRF